MKIKVMLATEEAGQKQAVLVLGGLRSEKFGAAVFPGGNVVVAFESEDGAPGPDVSRALRQIADSIDRGVSPVHDVTPIIPQAEA
jgi:hypothetical protein